MFDRVLNLFAYILVNLQSSSALRALYIISPLKQYNEVKSSKWKSDENVDKIIKIIMKNWKLNVIGNKVFRILQQNVQ